MIGLMALAGLAPVAAPRPVLWYDRPTMEYMSGLPLGNGRIGAMVLGEPGRARIALNHQWLWRAERRSRMAPDTHAGLAEFRKLMFEGKVLEANRRAGELLEWKYAGVDPYQPVGDLWIDIPGVKNYTDYRRELDISTGIARTTFRSGGVNCTEEVFVSRADNVVVVRIAVDKAGALTADLRVSRKPDPRSSFQAYTHVSRVSRPRIGFRGMLVEGHPSGRSDDDTRFAGETEVTTDGSIPEPGDPHGPPFPGLEPGLLRVSGASHITLVTAMATEHEAAEQFGKLRSDSEPALPEHMAQAALASAIRTLDASPDALLARHVAAYRKLFDRVYLRLGSVDRSGIPTDRRLDALKAGALDPGLEALYFLYGRYLLMASSGGNARGGLPANLQGIWCEDLQPAWESDYHTNINVEMNYWPAEVANLSECQNGLFDWAERATKDGRAAARSYYGCGGTWIAHALDAWAHNYKQDGPYTEWIGAAPWLAQHFWWRWEYTGDRAFLAKRAYPFMKEAAAFFQEYLVPDPRQDSKWNGRLVTVPSYSPENSFRIEGQAAQLCVGATMDFELIHDLHTHLIRASEILGLDAERRKEWQSVLDRLPPLQIGKYGQLQEWLEDYEEAEPGHRHMSHLFALFPGDQITLEETPELAQAARVSLERRLSHEGGHTGWSRSWTVGLWARLGEGDLAEEHLRHLIADFATITLLDLHPPRIFQIDGNFGGTAGVAEMLMQSHDRVIRFLPALPKAWSEGEVSGLVARGGVEIGVAWSGGRATRAKLTSRMGGGCRLRPPMGQRIRSAMAGRRNLKLGEPGARGDVTVSLPRGRVVELRFQ